MEDDQDEVNIGQHIGHITSGGQTTSNVYGALGTTTIVVDKEILRYIIQHNKVLDFIFPNSNMLERESNYQVWSFKMTRILKRHRIWMYCVNLVSRDQVIEIEIEDKKLALDTIPKFV
jgi:hypothetical protein